MTSVFDPKKPVQTRDGRPVRIICTDRKSFDRYSIVALVVGDRGLESVFNYQSDGRWLESKDNDYDLINVPQVKWLCCFTDGPGRTYHDTEEEALRAGKISVSFVCVVKVVLP